VRLPTRRSFVLVAVAPVPLLFLSMIPVDGLWKDWTCWGSACRLCLSGLVPRRLVRSGGKLEERRNYKIFLRQK
jgi:hypothetical protein